ncbi:MAG: hypothetical protein JNL67_10200 [Planctomycetaceae bacterium]|nr:hypothetical protein [Planctomycetaceae bacterium]
MDRQKLLLLLLIVVAVGYGGDWAYRSWVEEPFRMQEKEEAKLEKSQSEIHDRSVRAKTLIRDLPDFEQRSLPANSMLARQAYQAWCWQWVKRHEIATPTVDVSEPRPRTLTKTNKKDALPDMYEIGVTVRGVAPLQVFVDFLADFHQTKFLHRIDALSLTPVNQGRQLSFSIVISALSLKTALHVDRLPGQTTGGLELVQDSAAVESGDHEVATTEPTPVLTTHTPSADTSENSERAETTSTATIGSPPNSSESNDLSNDESIVMAPPVIERPWQEVVRRNMFAAGGGMTVAKSVKLSAITEDVKGVKQAWFRNVQQGPTQMVDLGRSFSQGALSATVIELHDEYAILQIEEDRVRVQIGQVIADGVALVRIEK